MNGTINEMANSFYEELLDEKQITQLVKAVERLIVARMQPRAPLEAIKRDVVHELKSVFLRKVSP